MPGLWQSRDLNPSNSGQESVPFTSCSAPSCEWLSLSLMNLWFCTVRNCYLHCRAQKGLTAPQQPGQLAPLAAPLMFGGARGLGGPDVLEQSHRLVIHQEGPEPSDLHRKQMREWLRVLCQELFLVSAINRLAALWKLMAEFSTNQTKGYPVHTSLPIPIYSATISSTKNLDSEGYL